MRSPSRRRRVQIVGCAQAGRGCSQAGLAETVGSDACPSLPIRERAGHTVPGRTGSHRRNTGHHPGPPSTAGGATRPV